MHFGGVRHWFACPSCWRRCRILYGGTRFRCRICRRAAYELQYQHQALTTCDRRWRLRERLEERGGLDSRLLGLDDGFPPRPPRMHDDLRTAGGPRRAARPPLAPWRWRHAAADRLKNNQRKSIMTRRTPKARGGRRTSRENRAPYFGLYCFSSASRASNHARSRLKAAWSGARPTRRRKISCPRSYAIRAASGSP